MSYGLEIWDEAGVKTLSVTDRITRLHSIIPVSYNMLTWHAHHVTGMAPDGTWAAIPLNYEIAIKIVNGAVMVQAREVPRYTHEQKAHMRSGTVIIFRV